MVYDEHNVKSYLIAGMHKKRASLEKKLKLNVGSILKGILHLGTQNSDQK